ncbi:hypothetical protein [Enterococcus faecium]|uniref:hypothetical protein n=1 Tax=Enterococcus faecium TaxID=1352 RepID=UPI00155FAD1B|nr:hypothetical protein [Enterococcus faecium]NRE83860.1 hypothetical protein [Enterococcus faecium]
MRLREVQKIINENTIDLANLKVESSTSGNSQIKKILGYNTFRKSIINLLETNLFPQEKEIIDKEQWLPSSASDSMSYGVNSYNNFMKIVQQVKYKSEGIITIISQNLHSESEDSNSLIISLPDRELSFDEFSETILILKDTFKLLRGLKEFQTDVVVENFDVGTNWLVVSLLSSTAVTLFGKLVSLVQRSQVGTRQIKALDKQLESLDLDEQVRATVRESQIKANQAIYTKLTEQFLTSNNLSEQAEIITQMTKVTENIDKILSMGVGFEASVSASIEVSKSFPDLKEQKLLDSTKIIDSLKKIDHSTENEED